MRFRVRVLSRHRTLTTDSAVVFCQVRASNPRNAALLNAICSPPHKSFNPPFYNQIISWAAAAWVWGASQSGFKCAMRRPADAIAIGGSNISAATGSAARVEVEQQAAARQAAILAMR